MSNSFTRPNMYLVSDVHSYYDAMIRALREAGFFDDPTGKLVILGDALDRGGGPIELIDFMLRLKEEDRLIYIRGNHEELLSDMLFSITNLTFQSTFDTYGQNGTFDTGLCLANSYYDERLTHHRTYPEDSWCYMDYDKAQRYGEELVTRIRESRYYRELHRYALDYYETEHYIFCHGFIPVNINANAQPRSYTYNPDWREAEYDAWKAARWLNGMDVCVRHGITEPGKTVICGHFYTGWGHEELHGNDAKCTEPFVDYGIIAIDAGTYDMDTEETKKVNCVLITPDGKAIFEGKVIHTPED